MSRARRMRQIASMEDNRAQEAARELAAAQRAHAASEKMLLQLQAYRTEYRSAGFRDAGGDALALQNFREFLSRLDQGIAEQRRRIEATASELEICRLAWIDSRGRVQSLEKLADKAARVEERESDRREQRVLDDLYRGDRRQH